MKHIRKYSEYRAVNESLGDALYIAVSHLDPISVERIDLSADLARYVGKPTDTSMLEAYSLSDSPHIDQVKSLQSHLKDEGMAGEIFRYLEEDSASPILIVAKMDSAAQFGKSAHGYSIENAFIDWLCKNLGDLKREETTINLDTFELHVPPQEGEDEDYDQYDELGSFVVYLDERKKIFIAHSPDGDFDEVLISDSLWNALEVYIQMEPGRVRGIIDDWLVESYKISGIIPIANSERD